MLTAMMDGRALTATELAAHAGVTPQTASGHLARLLDAGLIAMERQGRHRYHRLASAEVARMLEGMMQVAARSDAGSAGRAVRVGPRDAALRAARTCYDHLAGRLAVALADALVECGHIELSHDGGAVTPGARCSCNPWALTLPPPRPAHPGVAAGGCSVAPAWTGASAAHMWLARLAPRSANAASRSAGCAGSRAHEPSP